MNCRADIEKLADVKLQEAECLLKHGYCDGAYYIGGYSIELLLKAKVCKTLGITDFFLFNKGKQEAYKPYKTHDYNQLLLLSGLYTELHSELDNNLSFKKYWSLVREWEENCRYFRGRKFSDVSNFINAVKEVGLWIQKNL